MIPLKQSTAYTWKAGPFLDDTDGKTAETALSIAQADIRLTKNGGDYAQSHNSTGATHDEGGEYDVPLDTTDTGTVGHLKVLIHKTGALPVWENFWIFPANVFDSLQANDYLQVDAIQLSGTGLTGRDIGASVLVGDKTGFSLSNAGILAIWHQALSEISTASTVGKLIKDNLDVAISSRLASSSYSAPPTAAEIRQEMDSNSIKLIAIYGKTEMLPAVWFSP